MAKMFNYMAITIGIWIILSIMGVTLTGTFIADKLGITSADSLVNLQSSAVWLKVVAALAALTVGAVFIGIFTKSISAIPATAVLVTLVFLTMIMDMIQLINLVSEVWIKNILWFFISVYTGGFLITAYDWVRGID